MAKRADFPASDVANAAASLAKDIAAQMPQWKLASSGASVSDAISAPGDSSETQQGVDVATLRAKFLRGRSATDAVATGAARGRNTSVEVFKVEPKKGGPSQIADRRNGKISIVSG